jgi:DKNYY family
MDTSDYKRKSDGWYWLDRPCKGADVATFSPKNNVWATDSKGLFKQNVRVKVADPNSIRVLNLLFATDDQQVYYIMGVAKDIVDVATFDVLDAGQYVRENGAERRFGFGRDSQNVYAHDFFSGKPKVLKGASPATFARLIYGFAKDDKQVWVESQRIKRADPVSFEPINSLYSRDQKHAYYCESALPEADPSTFGVIGDVTAIDRSHVYFMRDVIAGADPDTYRIDPDEPRNGRDALSEYSWGKVVSQ